MAVQTIYTGKGLEAPQVRGYAMQALSQFGAQEQARKTMDVERGYKDRDTFAKMLELDPVYASSQAAQKRIAAILEGYKDEMTMMNKKRIGPTTTTDLMKMQQSRGRAMAEMEYIKGANDEFIQAAKQYNASPWKYDDDTWNDYQRTWLEDGVRPDAPPLLPAAQDPIVMGLENLKILGIEFDYTDESRELLPGGGEAMVKQVGRYNIPDNVPFEDIISHTYTTNQPWNIYKTFTGKRTPEAERAKYISMANGDEAMAADLWYNQKMKDALNAEDVKYKNVRVPRDPMNYQSREQSKTYLSRDGKTQFIDNNPAFTKQKVYGGMVATKGSEGIRFQDQKKYDVPVEFLDFSKELGLPPATRVWVIPSIAADGKVEFGIDSKTTGDITISVDEYGKLPKAQRKKYKSEYSDDGTATYKYNEPIPENITAIGDVDVVGTFLDPLFLQRYNEWFGETNPPKATTTTTTKTGSSKLPADWYIGLEGDDRDKVNMFIKNNPDSFSGGSESNFAKAAQILLDNGYINAK